LLRRGRSHRRRFVAYFVTALHNRLTDQAHIITTGTESYRFRRTAAAQRKAAKA